MNKLFLGIISLLLCFTASFSFAAGCLTDNGDGTLTDPNTGLIWQNCAVGETWDGKSCTGNAKEYSWIDALVAADENRFQNKNDWILPTKGQYEGFVKSNCRLWPNGRFWTSTENGTSGAWFVYWFVYFTEKDILSSSRDRSYPVHLVRASQLADFNAFYTSLNIVKMDKKEHDSFKTAEVINTVAAFTEFLNKYPNGKNELEVKAKIENMMYEEAKRINTVVAYKNFLNTYNIGFNSSMARIELDKLIYEPTKRANTASSYIDFVKKNPYSNHVTDAKEQIKIIFEQSITKAEAAFKCEEARQLDKQSEAAGIPRLSNFDSCVDKRKFNNVLNLKNPQQQYLEAVKYENENERSRAKRVYLTIMDKFSTSPVAMKAADRIASLKDVEAVESASSASQAAAERAAEASRRAGEASRDAAYTVNRKNSEQCQNNRNACFSGCGVYKNYSQRSSCESGCPLCAN